MKSAFRQLKHSPGFTLVATLTLALGIGANSAIFALVDASLLRPLPFREPDRLVTIWELTAKNPKYVSPLNMLDWNTRSRTFEKIAGFTPSVGGMVMAGADGNAETVSRQWVTAGHLRRARRHPDRRADVHRGRRGETRQCGRAERVVVADAIQPDPSVIGRAIRFDGTLWTVVGIVPKDFQLLGQTSMWALRSLANLPPRVRGAYVLQVVGRMKPGVSLEAAEADLGAVAAGLETPIPTDQQGPRRRARAAARPDDRKRPAAHLDAVFRGRGLRPHDLLRQRGQPAVARATVRMRELAVRSALGAGRSRIIRQLLTESLVLSLLGGVLGTAIGAAILSAAAALIPEGLLPPAVTLTFDMRIVAFCAGTALLVGLIFGVMPALKARGFRPPR